jgi:UDP-N-acetylmuramoyl-L-alanyl-D-glutamate--2,6-diaminopimelate ligase
MRYWNDIKPASGVVQTIGEMNPPVETITFDSRKVEKNCCFVAQKGTHNDGHRFIPSAIEKGASVIVCEDLPETLSDEILYVQTDNADRLLGLLAAVWFGFPSEKMKVVGVTGTNGKTSIASLLYGLTRKLGYQAGLISTITTNVGDHAETATHTTPDAWRIQSLFAQMLEAGCEYCFMEVSSHAVVQQRIAGIYFSGGIFTNLTHDHLDYHKTFTEYLKAKKGFFDGLPSSAFALVNLDDRNGEVMVQNTLAKKFTFSTRSMATFRCRVIEFHISGMLLEIDGREVWTRFVGKFNASNLLAVYACARLLGHNPEEILSALSELTPVSGRFETIRSNDGRMAIVDYAHTPDALKNVLGAISEINSGNGQVITVIGAGGDRDRTKRPEMAREATLASDKVILTSDNPRSEDPDAIIREMEAGVTEDLQYKVISITDRREAIKTACLIARAGDIILIAGKGHEDYQEIKGVKFHFDDREIVRQLFGINQ